MDDLLREFLTETSESLDTSTISWCGSSRTRPTRRFWITFPPGAHHQGNLRLLGLPRLEALAHAGETLMGKFRDGMPVRPKP